MLLLTLYIHLYYQCFYNNGTYTGGRLFVVNGRSSSLLIPVQGFVLDLNGKILGNFGSGLKTPHDVATSSNGSIVYVVEIGPNRAWKFVYSKFN